MLLRLMMMISQRSSHLVVWLSATLPTQTKPPSLTLHISIYISLYSNLQGIPQFDIALISVYSIG